MPQPAALNIQLNGEPQSFPSDTTVADLLKKLELNPQFVAVEVNLELVPRTNHSQQQLAEGDRVEIVTLVGGG
jgi:sulfur carrier protein